MILGILLLLAGLTISAVAIYYSVLGLAAIFAAATMPIYIMGGTLEIAKLVAATWLKANWNRAAGFIKWYMIAAVFILMAITSMGIFGFLSKAHLDQAIPTSDVAAQIALLDEKIKTQRDNIDTARAAIMQMDAQVNQRLSGRNADQSAERSVQIRRAQAKERAALQNEIAAAQKEIARLNEERAPIASQLRKVEAEVGPIKYIAQFVYGQEADQNLLEKAVTWVIILIVVVFDPLAVAMLLAAQMTFGWYRQKKEQVADVGDKPAAKEVEPAVDTFDQVSEEPVQESIIEEVKEIIQPTVVEKNNATTTEEFDIKKHPYLFKKFSHFKDLTPIVHIPKEQEQLEILPAIETSNTVTADNIEIIEDEPENQDFSTETLEPSKKKIHSQTEWETDNTAEEVTYIQNSEQQENSLWKRIKERESDEFKAKDYLRFVYTKEGFEDFQYDDTVELELDKFIKDIKSGSRSFSDYTNEQLKFFAGKIYELRKN